MNLKITILRRVFELYLNILTTKDHDASPEFYFDFSCGLAIHEANTDGSDEELEI